MDFELHKSATPVPRDAPQTPVASPFLQWRSVGLGMGIAHGIGLVSGLAVLSADRRAVGVAIVGLSAPVLLSLAVAREPTGNALRRHAQVYLLMALAAVLLAGSHYPALTITLQAWGTLMVLPSALWLGARWGWGFGIAVAVLFSAVHLCTAALSPLPPDGLMLVLQLAAMVGVPLLLAWVSARTVRTMENALRTAHGSLATVARAERMAGLGAMVAGVTHEVNNPLTYVMVNLDALKGLLTDAPVTPEQVALGRQLLADATEGTQRMARLVAQLKGFARGDHEPPRPMPLDEAVDGALRFVRPQLPGHIHVNTALLPGVTVPSGHAVMHLVMNLVTNAGNALAQGPRPGHGDVRITLELADAASVRMEVHDNGPGVPEALRGRVFDPFFTTRVHAGGTGLGLSICRDTVQRLGGRISVGSSALLGGACFRVELPVVPAVPVGAPMTAPRGTSATEPSPTPSVMPHVLIVDDERLVVQALSRLFSQCVVTGASTAEEALLVLGSRSFALILCDVNMPGMGGRGLLEALRRDAPHQASIMVFMTGGGVHATELDGVPVLFKPITRPVVNKLLLDRRLGTAEASESIRADNKAQTP